jgi:amidophosphoribosyltransferase
MEMVTYLMEGIKVCGIFGAYNCPKAAEMTYVGLHEMQSRAKEYAGIASWDKNRLYREAGTGIVQTVFTETVLGRLFGRNAIGHIRYATVSDDPSKDNAQPLVDEKLGVAISHNGNLTNTNALRSGLCQNNLACSSCQHECPLKTGIDTELILRRFCSSSKENLFERMFEALSGVKGSYSLLLICRDAMIVVRDLFGNRPLWLGSNDGSWFVSSETVSFQNLGIKTEREIAPGEILLMTSSGIESRYFDETRLSETPIPHVLAKCIFELLYYASPASTIFGQDVTEFRLLAGKKLHECCQATGDLVVDVPDSAKFHAIGWSLSDQATPYRPAIIRSHYIGRTFVEGLQELRMDKVALKFTPIRQFVEGKRIILIDDSIVRLTTLPRVVQLLRMVGAKEVHARIPTPRIKFPCHYGIDTPTRKELIASDHTVEEIRVMTGLDSLQFLTVPQLQSLLPDPENYCFACMTGQYPIPIDDFAIAA